MNGPFVASNRCSIITAVACQKVHWNSGSSRSTVQIAKVIYYKNSWRIPTRLIRWQKLQNLREIQSTPYFLQLLKFLNVLDDSIRILKGIAERFLKNSSRKSSWLHLLSCIHKAHWLVVAPFLLELKQLTHSGTFELGFISDFQILYWFFSTTIRQTTSRDGSGRSKKWWWIWICLIGTQPDLREV